MPAPVSFLRPRYGQGCFADLPPIIETCLTGLPLPKGYGADWGEHLRRYDVVITLFVDAFGWRFLERHAERSPAIQRFLQDGKALRWTAQFPSTTAAHTTCIHTGLTPGQSGVYEWQYYEPTVDRMITPLMFSFSEDEERETLKKVGVTPDALYPQETIYQRMHHHDVNSYVYQAKTIANSTFSRWNSRGATTVPYHTLPESFANLRQRVLTTERPAYFFHYWGAIDTMGHEFGPDSAEFIAEAESYLFCLDRILLEPLAGKTRNTLLILTADHGQINTYPPNTVYLDLDARFRPLDRWLRTDRNGKFLAAAGSARDLFLSIQPEHIEKATTFLSQQLEGKAWVVQTQELIEQGYFGPANVTSAFLERVGNLIVLPFADETVHWYDNGNNNMRFFGHHGGLTSEELEIPVGLYTF